MAMHGNDESLCQEAKEYYYEILCRDGIVVPEAVTRHVERCSFCQEQIRRIRETFVQPDGQADAPDSASDKTDLDALSRQFEFLGETVACSQARPFLPGLLPSSSPIRIPTPISVHVENCPQCTRDRDAIAELGLSDEQLRRLGRFYSQPRLGHSVCGGQSSAAAAALAAFSFDGTTPEALDHVCRCPACRSSVYHQREQAAADPSDEANPCSVLLCNEISAADLFDFVLPFGMDASAVNGPNGRRDAIATHLRTCRSCRERVRSLHRTIHGIAERADSSVRTLYRCKTDDELALDASRESWHRYPVHVQIQRPEPLPGHAKRRPRVRLRKQPILQGTALAAAVVLVGSLLLLQSSTATGKNAGDLLRAVRHKPNVHIACWDPNGPEASYEMWVSRDLSKIVRKVGQEWEQYDVAKGCMTGVGMGFEPGVSVPLAPKHAARCARYMEEPLGDIFRSVRPGDDFAQVDSVASGRPGVSLTVYELVRKARTANGAPTWTRLTTYIDPDLELPIKVEFSSRESEDLEWKPGTTTYLSYPTAAEIENELRVRLPSE